eukprot:gene11421-4588_t
MLKLIGGTVTKKTDESTDSPDISTENSERELKKTVSIESVKKSTDGEEDEEDSGLSLMDFLKKEPPKKETKAKEKDELLSLFDILKQEESKPKEPKEPKEQKKPKRDLKGTKKDEELFSLFDILNEAPKKKDTKKETSKNVPKPKKEKSEGNEMFSLFDMLREENNETQNTNKKKHTREKSISKSKKEKSKKEEETFSLFDLLREEKEEAENQLKQKSLKKSNFSMSFSKKKKEEKSPTMTPNSSKKDEKTLKKEDSQNPQKHQLFMSFSKPKKAVEPKEELEEVSIFDFLKGEVGDDEQIKQPKKIKKKPLKEVQQVKSKSSDDFFSLSDVLKDPSIVSPEPETPRTTKRRKDSIMIATGFFKRKELTTPTDAPTAKVPSLDKKTKSWSSIEEKESKKVIKTKEDEIEDRRPLTARSKRNSIKLPKFVLNESDDSPSSDLTPMMPTTPRSRKNSLKIFNRAENSLTPTPESTSGNSWSSVKHTIERKKHETLISVFGSKKKDKETKEISSRESDGGSEETDSTSTHKETDPEEEIKKKILESRIICDLFPFQFCITDKICSKYFKKCLESQYCSENLIFYNSIKEFKQLESSEERKQLAESIMKEFFDIESQYELNIQASDIRDCKSKFEEFKDDEFPITFFDDLLRKILTMLKIEEYHKFITSSHFEEYYRTYGHNIFLEQQENKWKTNDENEEIVDVEQIESDSDISQ